MESIIPGVGVQLEVLNLGELWVSVDGSLPLACAVERDAELDPLADLFIQDIRRRFPLDPAAPMVPKADPGTGILEGVRILAVTPEAHGSDAGQVPLGQSIGGVAHVVVEPSGRVEPQRGLPRMDPVSVIG